MTSLTDKKGDESVYQYKMHQDPSILDGSVFETVNTFAHKDVQYEKNKKP
jgi:hypothetical protein